MPQMTTRREFFKKTAMLSSSAGLASILLPSIQRASAINPPQGSTYLDAEHIVILMQENRSFDHSFGTLRGVRGFNDPRAVTLPNANPVWLQSNSAGETYAPFHLNIKDTKATWLGSLPHSWTDQTDAKNHGNHDRWLIAKPSGHPQCAGMPLTMGYYNREDIPFYYALADAFTVCDQHFCSSLTGTTPNRLYLWTGTIRQEQHANSPANVRNSDVDYDLPARWTTFPERLEESAISWKVYQNELSFATGLSNEEDAWLANFTDNPLEWFPQYQVRFSKSSRRYLEQLVTSLPAEIEELKKKIGVSSGNAEEAGKLHKELQAKEALLEKATEERAKRTSEEFEKLPERERNLHSKGLATNSEDPSHHELTTLRYHDENTQRELRIPKGDVLYQFRKDAQSGNLPAVSWVVAPEQFSDHPGAPWYGAWYLAEVLDILTHNPDVWKKTIFILTYDENDGYFDHVPPFGVPCPGKPETGATSPGIDAGVEYWMLEQDLVRKPAREARGSSIGLGFRVPMVVASPWSRGGYVCSQVFDHTSVLQFLEHFLSQKKGKEIKETNISAWRRAVCGDLTSIFRPYHGEGIAALPFPEKDAFLETVHKAQFKKLPGFQQLSPADIDRFKKEPHTSTFMPQQEKGVRPACPLPYQLYVGGKVNRDGKSFELTFEARDEIFAKTSAGSPFHVYTPGKYLYKGTQEARTRAYAVAAGHRLMDSWEMSGFENGVYDLRVCGPNGFFREFTGTIDDPLVDIQCEYSRHSPQERSLNGDIEVLLINLNGDRDYTFRIKDHSYGSGDHTKTVGAGKKVSLILGLSRSLGWYDFSVMAPGQDAGPFERRYAGHVETGKASHSDPAMGRVSL
jgi:phospholipase C